MYSSIATSFTIGRERERRGGEERGRREGERGERRGRKETMIKQVTHREGTFPG